MAVNGKMNGKVVLVTGGGGAIGGASARSLASEGAKVLVADERAEAAESVSQEIIASGGAAEKIVIDVADPTQGKLRWMPLLQLLVVYMYWSTSQRQ